MYSELAIERDAYGGIQTFFEAQVRSTVYVNETERGDVPFLVDELHLPDGTWMLPTVSVIEEDGMRAPIGDIASRLIPITGSDGREVLRNPLYIPGKGAVSAGEESAIERAVREAEESVSQAYSNVRFEAQFGFYPSGLWVAAEAEPYGSDVARIYVARLALFIAHQEGPGLVPVVFPAEGADVGYLPAELHLRTPWLYTPVTDEDFES